MRQAIQRTVDHFLRLQAAGQHLSPSAAIFALWLLDRIGRTPLLMLVISPVNPILNLMNVQGFWQWIIKGIIVIVVVAFYREKE